MNTSFGATTSVPSFNFLSNNAGPFMTSDGSNNHGKRGFVYEQNLSQEAPTRQRDGRSLLANSNASASAGVGPLVMNPESLGFQKFSHAPRETPKFLVGQQPQLKQKDFVQDPWDRANQQKMSQLEANIDDVEDLYDALKKMRDVERKVMENKGLVDKADLAKDLTEAIAFQGTCLDMCPVFERARRNVEHTVFSYEKDSGNDKKASKSKALKVFARPAAAAAPPLPSDVRPPHILSQTLDYIVDNLLETLPSSEGFLWDRMRSIRQDFTYQNYSGPEAVDCNERIVRIHLLIIHVMAKSNVDFSLQQELEQLHKSLITLSEIYDEVRAVGGKCPNEAEFRAYALLSKIRDPEYDKNIQELPDEIFQDEMVQTAICFRRIVSSSNFNERGFIKTENCLNFYRRFFQLLDSGKVPFLMSSFLELYVNEVRFYAFKALSHSLNKRHKAINPDCLIKDFLFNSREELETFCDYYSITVTHEGVELKSLPHQSHKLNEKQPLKHAILRRVDEMLDCTSYAALINNTGQQFAPRHLQSSSHSTQETQVKITTPSTESPFKSFTAQRLDKDKSNPLSFSRAASSLTEVATPLFQSADKIEGTVDSKPRSNLVGNEAFIKQVEVKKDFGSELEEKQKQKLKEQQELVAQKKERRNIALQKLTNQIVQEVAHEQISKHVEELLQKNAARGNRIKRLAQNLYYAFLHEKLYQIYLESKAAELYKRNLKTRSWLKWKNVYRSLLKERDLEAKKRSEIHDVRRVLGVPKIKKLKLASTPRNDSMFAFTLPSSNGKNMTLSPVVDEVNKFSAQQGRKKEVWEPLDIENMYLTLLVQHFNLPESFHNADIFIYGKNWSAISTSWVMAKFNTPDKKSPRTLQTKKFDMKIQCIDSNYNPNLFSSVQLLVFNTGVTDSDIFDLEMKLQQDGEELIKLITGVSLNTNMCFSVLLLYWESAETPLSESAIYKCLKINRISKSYNSVIQDIRMINITGNAPELELENGLRQIAETFQFKLTDRGRYHASLQKRRSLAGVPNQKPVGTSNDIDKKMQKMLEQERQKNKKQLDARNTYAHLSSHVAASPRMNKRKLPVLLSKSKENMFKTPMARRTLSSSSPTTHGSHLAIKVRGPPRRLRSDVPSTPSHCSNIPNMPIVTSSESLLPRPPDSSTISNTSLERIPLIQEPVLFQTPVNSTTTNQSISRDSGAPDRSVPDSVLELKALIESVKRKVNND